MDVIKTMDLIERLLKVDRALMLQINSHWNSPLADMVFQHIRETYFWAPLYLFFIVFAALNFGKKGWLWILAAIVTISITDQVSSNLIKNYIFRYRPCRDPELMEHVRVIINYCPRSSSFTSSHATNHFGFATFVVCTLKQLTSKWIRLLFVFAAAVAYAQVYVGVHFPLDVICGGLIGTAIGFGMSTIFNKNIELQALPGN